MSHTETHHPPAVEEESGVVAVDVVGPVSRARFPGLCIHCAAPADHTVPLTRVFYRENGDDPSYYLAARVDAPACAGCVRAHRQELRPIDPEIRKKLLWGWLVAALPYVFPIGAILFILSVLRPNLLESLAERDPTDMAVWGALCGFFGVLALMFYRLIMRPGRAMIHSAGYAARHALVERGPLGSTFIVATDEPTTVQRALDFSDDESELFEPERHRFSFRNRVVAAGFAELNADRDWDPASTRAQLARRARMALIGVVVLFGIYALLQEYVL